MLEFKSKLVGGHQASQQREIDFTAVQLIIEEIRVIWSGDGDVGFFIL